MKKRDQDLVTKKILEQFLKKDGYSEVREVGNSWRGIAEASRKTGLSQMTIRRLLKEYPTPPKEVQGRHVWVTPVQETQIEQTISNLETIGKQLETIGKYFEQSLIVDLKELQARKELTGWTTSQFQDGLKKQVEADTKKTSCMEQLFTDALGDFNFNLKTLREITNRLRSA